MNKIKFLKRNKIELNGITYKPYTICELPERFGLVDEDGFSYFTSWFNYKGLTYIAE
tara:strand:+ start:407 stop:577 length:171 start_codon:yes stop_codon:yes gene_type:complete